LTEIPESTAESTNWAFTVGLSTGATFFVHADIIAFLAVLALRERALTPEEHLFLRFAGGLAFTGNGNGNGRRGLQPR
jgi:hypothetical protein